MADHLYPTPRHGTKRPRDDDGAAASAGRARVVTPDGDAGVAPTGSVSDRFVPTRGEADVADAFRARCIGGDDALRSALLSPRPAERVLAFRSPGAAVTPWLPAVEATTKQTASPTSLRGVQRLPNYGTRSCRCGRMCGSDGVPSGRAVPLHRGWSLRCSWSALIWPSGGVSLS